jgi:hypothetical protein
MQRFARCNGMGRNTVSGFLKDYHTLFLGEMASLGNLETAFFLAASPSFGSFRLCVASLCLAS